MYHGVMKQLVKHDLSINCFWLSLAIVLLISIMGLMTFMDADEQRNFSLNMAYSKA